MNTGTSILLPCRQHMSPLQSSVVTFLLTLNIVAGQTLFGHPGFGNFGGFHRPVPGRTYHEHRDQWSNRPGPYGSPYYNRYGDDHDYDEDYAYHVPCPRYQPLQLSGWHQEPMR